MKTKIIIELAKANAIGTYTSSHTTAEDYDRFMSLTSLTEDEDNDFIIWEPFEDYDLDNLQLLVEQAFKVACALLEKGSKLNDSSIFMINQYDQWFSPGSKVEFGIFTNKTFDEVKEIAMDGFEKLYNGFKDDVYSNGQNQWLTDKFNFGFCIEEIKNVNIFQEMW
ncbi:MAG: hypothetical protein WC656_01360 [Sulfurimonas sp.]|jgi:hypothetical protein